MNKQEELEFQSKHFHQVQTVDVCSKIIQSKVSYLFVVASKTSILRTRAQSPKRLGKSRGRKKIFDKKRKLVNYYLPEIDSGTNACICVYMFLSKVDKN